MAVDSDYVTDRAAGSRQTVTGQQPEQDLNSPREECGVFGVWAPGEDVAKLTYYGLYALQHRGQEAAGIAVADGSQVLVFKDLGLVSQVFDEQTLAAMQGHVAIGHCRYSTTGDTTWENAQPVFRNTAAGTGVALGHNGNLVNAAALAARARDAGLIATRCPAPATTDSDILGRCWPTVLPIPPSNRRRWTCCPQCGERSV
ncbi:amidophosphoribosyltransferase [Mycobacterium tuberculosis variant bovis BCG]|nr:amidophosphoribosyltransferase [Mycobacterium tuberculosis]AMC49448.1 amidophosphoribosyltransferase [Mycobacterium tuberculosis variant bovis BCG]